MNGRKDSRSNEGIERSVEQTSHDQDRNDVPNRHDDVIEAVYVLVSFRRFMARTRREERDAPTDSRIDIPH
jgi:hypothetical protein